MAWHLRVCVFLSGTTREVGVNAVAIIWARHILRNRKVLAFLKIVVLTVSIIIKDTNTVLVERYLGEAFLCIIYLREWLIVLCISIWCDAIIIFTESIACQWVVYVRPASYHRHRGEEIYQAGRLQSGLFNTSYVCQNELKLNW